MNQTYRAAVAAWLDRHWEEILTDIETLVRIPSVAVYNDPDTPFGNECRQALETALLLAQKYGFETENYENQCGSIVRPRIRVNNHLAQLLFHIPLHGARGRFSGQISDNSPQNRPPARFLTTPRY